MRDILSAISIKDKLIKGLGERLGDYKSGSAMPVKAIFIGAKVPKTFEAKGLEILISPTASMAQIEPMLNRGTIAYPEYEVRLIERSQGKSLDDVIRYIVSEFRVTRPPQIFQETDESFHQAVIRIPDYIAIK